MSYEIIFAKNSNELTELVNQYIESGYKPAGGVFGDHIGLYQAVYKDASSKLTGGPNQDDE